jgi:hypothetical protein
MRTASIISLLRVMMEPLRTSETSVYSNEAIRRYIPEGFHLQNKVCPQHLQRTSNTKFNLNQREKNAKDTKK